MKTTLKVPILFLVGLLVLTITACRQDHATPEFEQQDAPYTGKFAWLTKSQTVLATANGQPTNVKIVIEGTGTYSFAGTVTLNDEFELDLTTGI